MTDDRVGAWLERFAAVLPAAGRRRRRRAVAELAAHLDDEVAELTAQGAEDPVGESLRRVGAPDAVAAGFPSRRRPPLALVLWLPAAVAATVLAGTGYAIAQQVLRSGANDPQVQVAQDAAVRLAAGAAPAIVAGGAPVDLDHSLAVDVAVFGPDGHVLASTARLDGHVPVLPPGALRHATPQGYVVTWQPRPGVRQAAVVVPFRGPQGSGTVVAARSLRLVERREDAALQLAGAGWLLALAATAAVALAAARRWSPPPGSGGPWPGSPAPDLGLRPA